MEKSEQIFEKAKKVLVGGVNSPVRSFAGVGGKPVIAKKANGVYLWDADDNQYIDFVMSYGPHLFGHAHPHIVSAATEALLNSSCLGMTSEAEVIWAEKVLAPFPYYNKVRALNSGTEATMTALRLARGYTGRDIVVKFAGHYHGHLDSLLVDAGSGMATLSSKTVASSKGVPEALASLARVLPFNDEEKLEELFKAEGDKVSSLILEPIVGNMGVIPPSDGFLQKCREMCTKYGALLIFDEVMTGFRVGEKSTQGLYNVQPDLSCFGKIVGGGLPLSALMGPDEIMNHLSPLGDVYQAGTLSGNPVAISAGIAMLELIENEKPYPALEQWGDRFATLLTEKASNADIPIRVQRVGAMLSVFFRNEFVRNADEAREINREQFNAFFWALVEQGIMIPPSPFEAWFISTEHLKLEWSELESKLENAFERTTKRETC